MKLACLLAAAIVVAAACSTPTTPHSANEPTASATAALADATPQPGATDAPANMPGATASSGSPSPAASAGDRWVAAGTMANGAVSHAIRLPDGRVLTLAEGGSAEIWDPAGGGTWHQAPGLPKWRGEFAAVALNDGRVLVAGGGNAPPGPGAQSYSSTYILDPNRLDQGWVKAGLLGTARTAPSVALLPDGRVLVAGGYYLTRADEYGAATAAQVVTDRPTPGDPSGLDLPPRGDLEPPIIGRALATTELFDPATGEWSATGSMKYARFGAPAATLSDGRVLIASSLSHTWEHRVEGGDAGGDTAEIFDPATGRFDLTALPDYGMKIVEAGTLVALSGGGAYLVGLTANCKQCPRTSLRLVFDARNGSWTVDRVFAWGDYYEFGFVMSTEGVSRSGAAAARISGVPDRVLMAGGLWSDEQGAVYTASAELGDPRGSLWEPAPPMPEPRAGALAVALADGSVLVVGGCNETIAHDYHPPDWSMCAGPTGLTNAIRFLPGP